MTFAITPVGEGQMTVTEEMRKDAAAAKGSIDANMRLPGLYLAQSSSDLVKEGKVVDKEWFISTGEEEVTGVGVAPLFIVLTAQSRYRYAVETKVDGEDKQKVIWDAAKGALTPKQDADVAAGLGKRYTALIVVHVGDTGIDPHKIGPISYAAKGVSCLSGMKLSDAVMNLIYQGIPPFTVAWRFGSKLEKSPKGKGSWNVLKHEGPMKMTLDPAMYAELKRAWLLADGKRKHDEGMVYTGEVVVDSHALEAQADREAENIKDAIVIDDQGDDGYRPEDDPRSGAHQKADDYGDYATELPKSGTQLPKFIPQSALAMQLNYETPIRCGKDDAGKLVLKAAENFTANECQAAWDEAAKYPENKKAAAVCDMMVALAEVNGWKLVKF